MGVLDYLSKLFTMTSRKKSKKRPMQTVEIKVKMDCDGCERKVKNAVKRMKGVKKVEVNGKQSKVTVNGNVEPNKVLKRIKITGKTRADFWPYVPYSMVSQPYESQAYDKGAPAGYVKSGIQQVVQEPANTPEEKFSILFSDDNVHSCSIM